MKLEMDEKLKHRLIGIAVILSIATIFTPAIIKKSSQRFDPKVTVNVKLPPKPFHPHIAEKDKTELFKTARVAHVELEAVKEGSQLTTLSSADFFDKTPATDSESHIQLADVASASPDKAQQVTESTVHKTVPAPREKNLQKTVAVSHSKSKVIAKPAVTKHAAKPAAKHLAKPTKLVNKLSKPKKSQHGSIANSEFVVQLASFSVENNAKTLVGQLQKKGYTAQVTKVAYKKDYLYKVFVGHKKNRNEAEKLKHQLANNFKLNGFIVHTGVS